MSSDVISIIPTDPQWAPGEPEAAAARAVVAAIYPGAGAVDATVDDDPVFVDQGENFESVHCPHCAARMTIGWWHERMDEAWTSRCRVLDVRMPCCGRNSTLNDLDYRWPAGFARFVVRVRDPRRPGTGNPHVIDATHLNDAELDAVAAALGHPVRQVVARY